ncbi:hypothetical protein F5I97DRAFT_1929267 [Phlebopus sp. FC_14]|nr:hypothetical protein F5I97DRAFT_1929267 [Phlebopus sp. FC_14]
MKGGTRPMLLFLVVSCLLVFASASPQELLNGPEPHIQIRDLFGPPPSPSTTSNSPSSSANSEPPPTSTQTPTSAAPTSTTSHTSSTSASPTSSQQQQQNSSTPAPSSSPPSNTPPSVPPTSAIPDSTVASTATGANGEIITSVITVPGSTTSSPTPTQTSSSSGSSGLGTGSIVGLSVAGGVAVIGIISFFIWKFTRKRFSDFDDNEAIKWPELNAHGGGDVHALPTNSTGRAGFGAENESDLNLARAPSPAGGYAHSVAASSVPDVYATSQDPYAVPPLPHLNPNQPYHDDPLSYGQPGYYDPYRGPVPNTFSDALSDGHAEAIPMTQMARTRSPAPQLAYDLQARASPAPQAVLAYGGGVDDRSRSPNPTTLGAGRASPGPQAAYGYSPR